MAFTAREVIMTFRGQNYLSGAIRRIGADVGGLSRTAQLANQRAMLQARAAQLNYARSTAQAELMSVSTGSRSLGLQRARASLGITERRNVEQLRKIEEQRMGNLTRQMQTQQKINALSAVGSRRQIPKAVAGAEGVAVADQAQIDRALAGQAIVGRGAGRTRVAESLRIQQAEMERLRSEASTLNLAFERQSQVISNSSIAAQQLAARETELVQREGQLRQAIINRTRAIDENSLAQTRNNFEATKIAPIQNWSQRAASIEHAGRALQMFGLIGTAAIGAAADSAAKFNSQFTLAATQARPAGASSAATAQIATNIRNQVMGLMRQFPASAQEMADSFYQIFSGTNIQNVHTATNAVKVFNQMAVAGGTDLKTMTDAGISLYNNFGGLHGEFKNLTQAGNAFFSAVRYGRMNAEQFANALPNVIGIAKQVGLSFNSIAGAMATLTRQTGGRFTSRDATGIARMIEIFARPDFQKGAAKFGVSIKDAQGNMRPLLNIIDEFSQKTKGTARIDLLNLFKTITGGGSTSGHGGTAGTIQARRAFQYLINDIDQYRNVTQLVRRDNTELSKSFEAMSKTPGVQWAVFINRLKVLVYEIGTQAIPAFITLGRPIAQAVQWFNSLDDHTKHLIATIGAFAAAGTLIVGVLSAIGGGMARLATQFVIMQRMRRLEQTIASTRLTQTVASDALANAPTPTFIANPRGGAFEQSGRVAAQVAERVPPPTVIIDPKTGQAFKQAAQDAGSSEAGFIRAGTALKMFGLIGLTVALPFLFQYHSQILKVITGNTLLGNSIALVGVALAAMKLGLITKLTEASAFARPLIISTAVIVGLIAVFTNFAGSADLVRKALDNLFNSFAGYVITIGLMVAAVYKLRDALIAMKIAEEGATVMGALSAIGPAIATRVGSIAKAVGIARGAATAGEGVAIGAGAAEAGTVGLGAAIGAFLPALAVGGALMGGLYLWKRHLDAVHEAQQKVANTQDFLKSTLSGADLFKSFGDAGTKIENLKRAQIQYNTALKEMRQAERQGVTGDPLQSLKLNLYDATNAVLKAKAALNAFYRDAGKLSGLIHANTHIKSMRDNLKDLEYVAKNYPDFGMINARSSPRNPEAIAMNSDARLADIKARLGINNIADVRREISNYTKYLDIAMNTIGETRNRFRGRINDTLNSLIQLQQIPAQARNVMSNLNTWISSLTHFPRPQEINRYLRVVLRLQNANDVPAQFARQVRQIERMIATGQGSRLTHKQIDFLIKYVFKVDPRSDKAGQLRAQIRTYISASMALAAGQVVKDIRIVLPSGQLDTSSPKDIPTPNRFTALQRYWAARRAAIDAANKTVDTVTPKTTQVRSVQSWIDAVIKAEQAMKAHPYDVSKAQAYENTVTQMNAAFKNQPALLSAINDVLQTYTSNLDKAGTAADKAAKKQQVTFEQVLSGMQNMYQGFLQQEQSAMGQLFQGPFISHLDKFQWGGMTTGRDETRDLRSQVTQFNQFHQLISRIRSRGAPPELVAQLTALGPQAIDQIRAMARMSDPEIKKYFTLFKTAQRDIHTQTMADMQQQLAEYRKYGRNAALQIIAGFQSAEVPMTRAITRMIRRMFGKIPTEAQIAAQAAAKAAAGVKVPTGTPSAAGVAAGTRGGRTGSRTTTPTRQPTPLAMAPFIDPGRGRFDYRRIQHMTQDQLNQTFTVAKEWVGNTRRISAVVKQFNDPDLTRNQYRLVYRHLESEIRRELHAQGLPNLNNAQLERLIRNMFGYMPTRAARNRAAQTRLPQPRMGGTGTRTQGRTTMPPPIPSRVPAVNTEAWRANTIVLNRIKSELGNLPASIKNQYRYMYNDLAKEIIREFRSQHLGRPNDKTIERLIQERLGLKPPPGGWHSASTPRTTQSAGKTENHTHYHIVAPKSEHASIKSQVRHADFVVRTKHRPSR